MTNEKSPCDRKLREVVVNPAILKEKEPPYMKMECLPKVNFSYTIWLKTWLKKCFPGNL